MKLPKPPDLGGVFGGGGCEESGPAKSPRRAFDRTAEGGDVAAAELGRGGCAPFSWSPLADMEELSGAELRGPSSAARGRVEPWKECEVPAPEELALPAVRAAMCAASGERPGEAAPSSSLEGSPFSELVTASGSGEEADALPPASDEEAAGTQAAAVSCQQSRGCPPIAACGTPCAPRLQRPGSFSPPGIGQSSPSAAHTPRSPAACLEEAQRRRRGTHLFVAVPGTPRPTGGVTAEGTEFPNVFVIRSGLFSRRLLSCARKFSAIFKGGF
jgi:hypothetical protein